MKPSVYNHYLERDDTRFVFNCLTGAVLELSPQTYRNLLNRGTDQVPEDELTLLSANGILVKHDVAELKSVLDQHWAYRQQPAVAGISLVPTLRCNLSCEYCYQGDISDRSETALPAADLKAGLQHHLRRLQRDYPIDTLEVNWYGGEPLLCSGHVINMSDWLTNEMDRHGVSLELSMVTNGYLLDGNVSRRLAQLNWKWVQVTLDGARETHDRKRRHPTRGATFDRIVDNVSGLAGFQDIRVVIRVNVDRQNVDTMPDMLAQLADSGLGTHPNVSLYFAPVREWRRDCKTANCISVSGFGANESELVRQAMASGFRTAFRPHTRIPGCSATNPASIVLDPQGRAHKCLALLTDSAQAVGLLTSEGVRITNPDLMNAWHSWQPGDRCSDCSVLPICMGGCAMQEVLESVGIADAERVTRLMIDQERCTSWRYHMNELLGTYIDTLRGADRT